MIYFFHGLLSTPHGTKYQRLAEEFEVESPDFQEMMDIGERFDKAERITRGQRDLVVVGSSFGGLLAGLLYSAHPQRFAGYVLMAPAFQHEQADDIERMPDDSVVIHGVRDEVVPLRAVRRICERHEAEVTEVDDDHRLHDSLDMMVDGVRKICEAKGGADE